MAALMYKLYYEVKVKVKVKGKDVDLYSASTCLQDSSNAHFVTET